MDRSFLLFQLYSRYIKISKYLDFKIGEVWTEVSKELYFENIRPVTPDVECIRQVQQEVEAKIKTVQTIQLDSIDQNLKVQSLFFFQVHTFYCSK